MLGLSKIATVIVIIEVLLLSFQLLNYLSRKQDVSRKRFLVLIVLFILFNLFAGSMPNDALVPSLLIQNILLYSIGIILACYYFYYLVVEFDLEQDNIFSVKWLVFSLTSSFLIVYFLVYFITKDFELSRKVFIVIPLIIGIYFCIRTVHLLYQKWSVLQKKKSSVGRSIIASNVGIIFMTTMPVTDFYGNSDLNILTVNISLIVSGYAYIRNHIYQSRLEFQFLQQRGFEERGSIVRENMLYKLKQHHLSSREMEIALLILKNKPYKDIGEEMFITSKTVSKHASNIFKKTKTSNKGDFTHWLNNS